MFVVDLSAWDELGHPTAGIYNVEEIESEDEVPACTCSGEFPLIF